jgi:hypothetical protein
MTRSSAPTRRKQFRAGMRWVGLCGSDHSWSSGRPVARRDTEPRGKNQKTFFCVVFRPLGKKLGGRNRKSSIDQKPAMGVQKSRSSTTPSAAALAIPTLNAGLAGTLLGRDVRHCCCGMPSTSSQAAPTAGAVAARRMTTAVANRSRSAGAGTCRCLAAIESEFILDAGMNWERSRLLHPIATHPDAERLLGVSRTRRSIPLCSSRG